MAPVIRLRDLINEMDACSDEFKTFLNTRTGELVTLSVEELGAAEEGEGPEGFPQWQQDNIRKAAEVVQSRDYRQLPTKYEIHEYAIMERFCYAVGDDELSRRLLNSIRGRGAFRYFRDTIHAYGIEEHWYQFREQALKDIAIDWLEGLGIAYTDEEAEVDDEDWHKS